MPAQPRRRQGTADASAMRRWRGNACAAASLTGCRRRERCAPIAGECPCSRVVGGASPVRVLCDDSSGLRANPCSARIISRMTSRRSSSCGSSRTMRLRAGARACRVASPRRRRHGEGPFSAIMSWQHLVASGWRQESRGFLKPALLPEEFGLLTRGSGLIGDGSGNRSGRLSGPDLPALTRAP